MDKRIVRIKLLGFFIALLLTANLAAQPTTWIATGPSANWNVASNWSGGAVPTTTSDVIFSGTSTTNCIINTPVDVNSISINAGFTGSVTNTTFAINIRSSYSQASGTFNGGSGDITLFGSWTFTGGVFNSTSGTFKITQGPFTHTGGNFNHNNGTVHWVDVSSCTTTFVVTSSDTFRILVIDAPGAPSCGFGYDLSGGTIVVLDTLKTTGTGAIGVSNGTLIIKKDLLTLHGSGAGSAVFSIEGVGPQRWVGPANQPCGRGLIGNMVINKAATDTLYIYERAGVTSAYTYVSGIIKTVGTLCLFGNITLAGPSHLISDVEFLNNTITIPAGMVITSDSTCSISGSTPIMNGGEIHVKKDMIAFCANGLTGGGTTTIRINGTGKQTFYTNSAAQAGAWASVRIEKAPMDTLVITRSLSPYHPFYSYAPNTNKHSGSNALDWTYVSGRITGDGILIFSHRNSSNATTIRGTHNLPNVSFNSVVPIGAITTINAGDVLTIDDTLFTDGTGPMLINGGRIDAKGNIFVRNTGSGAVGSSTIQIMGTGNQTFGSNVTLNRGWLPNIAINKPSGTLFLKDTVSISGNWLYTAGTVDATTFPSNFAFATAGKFIDGENLGYIQGFHDLTLIGTDTRTLQGNLGIERRLVLADGKIALGNFTLSMRTNVPANLVRTTGFVISENLPAAGYGRFEWPIGNTAAGATFVYPFGVAATNNYIPFSFEVQAPGNAGGKLSVATYATDWTLLPNNLPYPTGVTNINNILGVSNYAREVDRYWIPETTTFTTNPTGSLTFTYRDQEWSLPQNSIVESRLQAHRWLPATSAWEFPNNTSTRNVANNTVTFPNQNVFTPFTVVDPELPDLRISSNDTIVCLGTPINFFDLNVPTPPNSLWIFPGATPATDTSTATNPVGIMYTTTGCKDVILQATYAQGIIRDTFPCFITITNAPTVTAGHNDITCNGLTNGKVWVTVAGGSPGYTYQWGGTASTQTNTPDSVRTALGVGTYNITVSDAQSCSATATATVAQPTALTVNVTKTDITCNNGTNGQATATPTGGNNASYTYSWTKSPSPTVVGSTATITGLNAGTYNVTVTDASGCTASGSVAIANPASLGLTLAKTDALCNGQASGKAWATVTGGTGPGTYNYAWSPAGTPGLTPDTTRNQPAGTVSITVTDGNGCTVTGSVVIGQPAIITVLKGQTNPTCNAATTGRAWARASGGTTPYVYAWSAGTPSVPNGDTITGIGAGVYYLTTTDGNGCIKRDTFVLTQPTAIIPLHTQTNVSCNGGNNGSITVTHTGGPAPTVGFPTYTWQRNGSPHAPTTATINTLTAGTYTVIININNCLAYDTIIITQPPALASTTSQVNITCFNGTNGQATVNVTGGTGAGTYTYVWTKLPSTPVTPGNTATITGLNAGDYGVLVTDGNGCTIRDTVTLANPAALGLVLDKEDAICFGTATGRAWATVSGGTTPYTYVWSAGTFTAPNDDTTRNLLPGVVNVTVTDANGCTVSGSVTIGQASAIVTSTTQTNVSCFGGNNGVATVTHTGGPVGPTPGYAWQRNGLAHPGTANSITGLTAGQYTVIVTIGSCLAYDTVDITEPAQIIPTITGVNVGCFGAGTGSATVTYTGGPAGAPGYAWQQNGAPFGGNTATINNLTAGTYTVIVEINGCFGYDTIVIAQNPALALTPSQVDITCFNGTDGEAAVAVTGGTGAGTYDYAWVKQPSSTVIGTTATITGLDFGTYEVTVTDDSSCTATATVTLANPAPIGLQIGGTDASCFGICDGEATVFANGGTSTYTYGWSNGATTATITGLCAGRYRVTVTDGNGCTSIDSVDIESPTEIVPAITATNVSCFGGNDGEVTVAHTGGPVPNAGFPTYTWQLDGAPFAQTTATITSLVAGIYTVTIDINGCLAYDTIAVTQPTEIVTNLTGTNISCFGGTDGEATVTHTGGPVPNAGFPTYAWQLNGAPFGGNTATIGNLTAGTYTVIVEINGCFGYDTIDIIEPAQLTSTITGTDPSCNGGTAGSSVTVTASGGTPNPGYNYSWTLDGNTVGTNSNTVTGAGAGVYIVTISDSRNCTINDTITLNDPPAIVIDKDSLNVNCFGNATGKAWVTISGGTPGNPTPYTIAWSGGVILAPGDTIANLLAGTYRVTVTDGRGCVAVDSFIITEPTALGVTLAADSVSCFGGSDGKAWATGVGGSGNYSFVWTPSGATTSGPNGDTIINVAALTYTVTITDDSSCTAVNSISILQPSQLVLAHDSINVLCFGGDNGKAWVTATGGSPGYTYVWSGGTPTGNGDTITTLTPGVYYVTVTDDNNCQAIDSVTITQPATAVTLVMDSNNVLCFGQNNGKAWVTATGGTPGPGGSYAYAWSGGITIGLQDTIINLTPGTYRITVTDANGCQAVDSVLITEPQLLSLDKDSTNVLCFADATGKAWVTINGGTTPYSNVVWTGTGTTSGPVNDTLNGLVAGTYTASVTDANGCTATATFTITQPDQLVINLYKDDVACFGDATGKVWASVTGGTGAYVYTWSGGTQAGANGDTIVGLIAGQYDVIVTDQNGCTATNSINVFQPAAALAVTMDSTNILCFGQTTGKAWATVTGGTTTYTYTWSGGTPSGADGDTIIDLAAGVYRVTITDANGCTVIDLVDIVEPALLTVAIDSVNVTCNGQSTGRAWATVAGGTGPFTYAWSGGTAVSIGDTIINLTAGMYRLTVTDANGCTVLDSVNITEPAPLVIVMDSSNVTCNGANDGRAWVTASGGNGGYTYTWSAGAPGLTDDTIVGLAPGIYLVTVTDQFNCTQQGDVTIQEPNLLLGAIRSINVRCFGENSGRAWITATGGNGGYTYAWSGGAPTNALGDTVAGLVAGTYGVTITDSKGCTFTNTVTITEPAALATTMDNINVLCFGANTGRAWVTVTGGLGNYDYVWSGGTPVGDGDTVRNLIAGTYYVTVTDDTGCIIIDTVSITQPATAVTLVKDSVNILCFGDTTGRAWVTASGGTLAAGSNYTYSWSRGTPVGIGDTVIELSHGIVRVTVTDNNGCEAVATFNITQPTPLASSTTGQNVKCFGESTGKAWVTANGGASGYTYAWSGGTQTGAGDTITNLLAGDYYVTITDANGCTLEDTVTITQPLAPLATTMGGSDVLCFGGNSGRAWVAVTGGTPSPGYNYQWSAGVPFGGGDSTLNLTAGPVSVTVTDANGCTISDTFAISEPATALTIVMDSSDVTCFAACDGKAWVTASGGTPGTGYAYQWANTTNTTDTLGALCPGNYVVTVTDANGCRAIDLVSVNEPDELLLDIKVDSSAYCNNNGKGQVTVSLTGGTGPYDYEWSNNDNTLASNATSNTINNLNAGPYTVTVTDANGCNTTATVTVGERSGPKVTAVDITATLCNQPNGAISLTVTTTDPQLDYDWSHNPLLTGPNANGLASATYTVTITDASTCDTVFSIFVPAIDKPVVDSVIIKDSYCSNEDGVAAIQVSSGVQPYVFTWSHDASLTTNVAAGLVEGNYSVTITDANGCDTSLTFNIVEIDAPKLAVVPNVPQYIYASQNVPIEVSLVSPIDSVYYTWLELPGLDCYDCTNPIATPERSTTYLVAVTDVFTGCQDTAYVSIIVKDETNLFIPNAITPNGDGMNDVWVIRELVTFPDNEVIIINRWGDQVFSASPYQNDWDGTFNGKPLPAGTYYYIIKLDNISESVSGPITIIK